MNLDDRPRAFVVGAYMPNGGTFMAYHLGNVLQTTFDYEAIAVIVGSENCENGIHQYNPTFPAMTVAEMENTIIDRDVLICNPSFSPFMFGLRLPGTKISYVQHFVSFQTLDCRFDHYVAVSG